MHEDNAIDFDELLSNVSPKDWLLRGYSVKVEDGELVYLLVLATGRRQEIRLSQICRVVRPYSVYKMLEASVTFIIDDNVQVEPNAFYYLAKDIVRTVSVTFDIREVTDLELVMSFYELSATMGRYAADNGVFIRDLDDRYNDLKDAYNFIYTTYGTSKEKFSELTNYVILKKRKQEYLSYIPEGKSINEGMLNASVEDAVSIDRLCDMISILYYWLLNRETATGKGGILVFGRDLFELYGEGMDKYRKVFAILTKGHDEDIENKFVRFLNTALNDLIERSKKNQAFYDCLKEHFEKLDLVDVLEG